MRLHEEQVNALQNMVVYGTETFGSQPVSRAANPKRLRALRGARKHFWANYGTYRNGSARLINSSSPGSPALRGLPGWMIESWQFSAASTSWR